MGAGETRRGESKIVVRMRNANKWRPSEWYFVFISNPNIFVPTREIRPLGKLRYVKNDSKAAKIFLRDEWN